MDVGCSAGVYIERYAEAFERFLDECVVAVDDVLRCDTFGAGLESDGHTMLVAAADECHGAAGKAEIACVDIGGHIYAGEMADVHRAIGVWERGGD